MILHLLFEGFDGLRATTSAFDDNAPSNGVTRRIGYAENGVDVLAREGKPVASRRYVLDRATWDARPAELRPDVTLVGVEAAREQLGLCLAVVRRVVHVPGHLHAVGHLELGEQAAHVRLHGGHPEVQRPGDLGVGQPVADRVGHLALPVREPGQERSAPCAAARRRRAG